MDTSLALLNYHAVTAMSMDVARHELGGGLKPSNKNITPPNEIKPISPFGLGLIFSARFVLYLTS